MDRYWADRLAAGTVAAVLLIGLTWAYNAAQQPTMGGTSMGSMMDGSMGTGTDPLSALLGGLLLAIILGVGYLLVRDQLTSPNGRSETERVQTPTSGSEPTGDPSETAVSEDQPTDQPAGEALLRYLPDDERRVLEPVIESPGVTQIEIRDRSGFSKSKVSQTLSDLEERGLVAREKQGRTYRVSPGADLEATEGER